MPQHTSGQTGETPEHKVPSITSWLFDSSMRLAIITAFLFLVGWFYVGAFFRAFGLDALTLDLPFYVALVSAFQPVTNVLFIILELVGVATIAPLIGPLLSHEQYLIRLLDWFKNKLTKTVDSGSDTKATSFITSDTLWWAVVLDSFKVTVVLMFVLVCLWLASRLGESNGYSYKRHPTKRAYLNFKADEKAKFDDRLKKASCEGRLMMLVQTKELVVVFAITNDGKFVEENSIFIVPRADLLSVQIQPIQSEEKLVNMAEKSKHSGACAKYGAASQRAAQTIQPTTASPRNSAP